MMFISSIAVMLNKRHQVAHPSLRFKLSFKKDDFEMQKPLGNSSCNTLYSAFSYSPPLPEKHNTAEK